MHSLRLPIVSIAVFFALLLCLVISLGNNASASTSLPLSSHSQVINEPPGAPAIISHLHTNIAGPTTSPAYAVNDVRQYINKWGFAGGPVVKGASLKIKTIKFITASQASQLMGGESIGRNSAQLVCYVEVKGPFNVIHMSLPPNYRGKISKIRQSGVMVFDAYTGNLLLWSV